MIPGASLKTNTPTILVVFGATGDLMARKLAPALLNLYKHQQCPDQFAILGFARRGLSDKEFQAHVKDSLDKHANDQAVDDEFSNLLAYQQGDFNTPESYGDLAARLKEIDDRWGLCTNKLFYLAVPPEYYASIFQNLADSGLTIPCSEKEGWTRILVEKPFGKNLGQAIKLDKLLTSLFKEVQVYRVDHYLAKEAIQNILSFRFSNNFLEANWGRESIEKIEIKLLEEIDIEGRGIFYDDVGALLDVGQNHLLQMLALATMDQPLDFSAGYIRPMRAEIIQALSPVKDIANNTLHAQYEGYRKQDGVKPNSLTETYFKIRALLNHPKWLGVPVFLEGGKNLPQNDKQIIITYKHPTPCLCSSDDHYKNQLFIRIQPNPGIAIKFWAKKPGTKNELEKQWLKFDYSLGETTRYQAEYTQLLIDAIAGDQTLFVSGEETLASWRFIDPIIRAWRQGVGELLTYSGNRPISHLADKFETQNLVDDHLRKQIGVVGLGKMGYNLSLRLQNGGWQVLGVDPKPPADNTIRITSSYKELVKQLAVPRIIWLMVPHDHVDEALFGADGLCGHLDKGDTIIDGGNSFYKESIKRAKRLANRGIRFIDVGVSGGPTGARQGASLMIGGNAEDFARLEPLFADLAVPGGYKFFAGTGAGHFVKMVHNGIEYGMMQAIAEGFTILNKADFGLNLEDIANVYNHGSVIESRLMKWLEQAFQLHGASLKKVSGNVGHTGEGEWTVEAAKRLGIKARVIEEALRFRVESEKNPSYTGQLLSALREQFGGHPVTVSKK
ncbi:glucose-6-phosphate dehydrogenase [Candidatus Saccharibacteria bacterium]|nr:glucose-6-phosphate dehydrogenase [Candidatus Saccharibacteria bacterium]